MKLNVKPVYVHLVHRSAYMGPCRGGTWEQLERSYDEMMAAENFAKMKEGLEKVYGGEKDICLQEPVYLEFLDEFVVRESHFEKVKDEDTDVFLLDGMMGQHLAVNIAKRYYAAQGRDIDIIKLNGSIELAPILGLSDVIVDIVETGTTLRENDLKVLTEFMPISARFIANRASYQFKRQEIDLLLEKLAEVTQG